MSGSNASDVEEIVEVLAGGWDLVFGGNTIVVRSNDVDGSHMPGYVERCSTLRHALLVARKHKEAQIEVPAARNEDAVKARVIEVLGPPLDGLRGIWSPHSPLPVRREEQP